MNRKSLRSGGMAASLALVLCVAAPAFAQGAGGNDKVAAEALFEQGRKLLADGKYAEACPRFADSQRLDPSPGTLLNLASCYEKWGKTATAWAAYKEAASAANAAGRAEYVATAQRHADALVGKLAQLTAVVPTPAPGLQVKKDGVDMARSAWGVPIPIDAGTHTIEASAPGYKPWSSSFEVAQDGAQVSVNIPALEAAPVPVAPLPVAPAPAPAPPQPLAPAEPDSTGSGQRIAGIVIGAVGLASLATSGVFVLLAKGKYNDSLANCQTGSPDVCSQTGVNQRNDARGLGNGASIAFGIGAAALLGGVVVWATAPSPASPAAQTGQLVIGPTLGGAAMQGTFW